LGKQQRPAAGPGRQHPGPVESATVGLERVDPQLGVIEASQADQRLGSIGQEQLCLSLDACLASP
jgi:hypothetical protein